MDQKMTRRRLLGTGAAMATAVPLATLPFSDDTAAAPGEPAGHVTLPTITLDDRPVDAEPAGGIPWIWASDPWAAADLEHQPIMSAIAEQAVIRMSQPLHSALYDVLYAMKAVAKTHMPADAYQEFRQLAHLWDSLYIPFLDFVTDVCARVLPQVDVRNGTFEEVLQAAFAAGGLPDVAAADALVRSTFVDCPNTLGDVRECFPDFDPADLSILKRARGFVARGDDFEAI